MTSVHQRYDVRIFQKECVSLSKAGYQVTLIVNDEFQDELCQGVLILSSGIEHMNRLNRMLFATKVVVEMALKCKADIYCIHDPELLRFSKQLTQTGAKVIFDSHEFYALQLQEKKYIPSFLRKLASKFYQKMEKHYLKYITAVLTPCTLNGKNYFEKIAAQTIFISNAPKLEEFYYRYKESNREEKMMCHVGSLTYERGIYHLIKAAGLAKCKLSIAGNYSSKEFKEKIQSMPEYKYVIDYGYLSREKVFDLYKRCNIGVSTLLDKGQYYNIDTFPTKIFEYMAMGLPVIISDTCYAKRLNAKYDFGICVDPESPVEIKDAILFLNDNPALAKKKGENGRKLIKNFFNWEREEEKLITLYESLEMK